LKFGTVVAAHSNPY